VHKDIAYMYDAVKTQATRSLCLSGGAIFSTNFLYRRAIFSTNMQFSLPQVQFSLPHLQFSLPPYRPAAQNEIFST